ncbi:hypothetical protein BJ165DRAFT_1568111, partial [Panaeolus papilionaceus]
MTVNQSPFRIAEMALEIQIERFKVMEVSNAREAAVQRLSDAYSSIRIKNEVIEKLQSQLDSSGKSGSGGAEATIKTTDPHGLAHNIDSPVSFVSAVYQPPHTTDLAELVKAREELLAAIPLPDNPPDPTLSAIIIPPPFSLHEFLNTAPGPLRASLANYKILHNATTHWCPEREEHGYMYVPAFKCSTNPRIATAHRWAPTDVVGRMAKPTECFYNREGVWYYAGSYRAFKLDDMSTTEWAQLSNEAISAIVKETIAARKNSSPQNTYETTQLYAAGALKVTCVGLQCVGFNQEVYKSMIEHSIKFSESKWKTMIPVPLSLGTANSISSPFSQPAGSMSSVSSVSASGSVCESVRSRSPAANMTTPLLTSG